MIYTGKNLEEALLQVQQKYNVSKEEIIYEIIEEKAGFLGIGGKVTISAYCSEDIKSHIQTYLNQYLNHLNLSHTITISNDNNHYKVVLDSSNNATLIGKNGQTLLALNTVLKSHLSANFKKYINVLIDINGYKEEKYLRIQKMAYRIAKEVQRTKINAKLDPMPNDERKAIHSYLTNLPYIRTISEGSAHQRYITIVFDENKK